MFLVSKCNDKETEMITSLGVKQDLQLQKSISLFSISFLCACEVFLFDFVPKHLDNNVTCHNCVHACMYKSVQIPKQAVHKLQREGELDYFFLMPFV